MQIRRPLLTFALVSTVCSGCASSGRSSYRAMRSDYAAIQARMRVGQPADDRALAASPLSRAALIRAVLDRNPTLETARQAWRAALARYSGAGPFDDPMLHLSAAPLSVASSDTHFGYEVELSQRIALGGKRDAEAALAIAEAEAAATDYRAARLQLAVRASDLYDEYFVAQSAAHITAEHVVLVGTLKQNATVALETGRGSAQESLQAEAELAQLEYETLVHETQRKVIAAQLNALLHRAPDAALPAPPSELPLPDATGDAAPKTASLKERPDIAMARARVRVGNARSQVASQASYPDLTLFTSYNSMWDMPEHRWMAGIELNLPLERASRNGAIEEAGAMRAAAESEVQSLSDEAHAELAVAELRIAEARRGVLLVEERLLPLAHDQVDAARADYISSQGSFAAVIEAAHKVREVALNRQRMRAELSKRLAERQRVQGRIPGLHDAEAIP